MVDALHRASRWLKRPFGCVIDLRPADLVPRVEIEMPDRIVVDVGGLVVDDERRARHAAADAALRSVVADGTLIAGREEEFTFYRYPDSPNELRDYIAAKWQQTRLASETHAEAAALLAANPGARLGLREQVAIRTLTSPAVRA